MAPLDTYLEQEQLMLRLDLEGHTAEADEVRHVMDGLWMDLIDTDRRWLDLRGDVDG